jgi:hypothetical protein
VLIDGDFADDLGGRQRIGVGRVDGLALPAGNV